MTIYSPLESLAAFTMAFVAGVVTAVGLRLYLRTAEANAASGQRS